MAAGGPEEPRLLARTVQFPPQGSESNSIRVEGPKSVVEKVVASIEKFVQDRENEVTETVEVAPEKHRLLIGRGGETRKNMSSQYNVNIDIPRQNAQGEARSAIKVSGQAGDVEKAKAAILEMTQNQAGETIMVPLRLHYTISDNGQLFRQLRANHKVTVDHAGQQPPRRPQANQTRQRANEGQLPLITDDADSVDNFSWEIVDHSAEGEDGEIPWVLGGQTDGVAKARAIVEKALEQASQHSATGYLILSDPHTYRYVIGQGGSKVNSIRKQTGCKIQVPKDQARGEAIELQGSREGLEEAKEMILEAVRNGQAGGGRGRRE